MTSDRVFAYISGVLSGVALVSILTHPLDLSEAAFAGVVCVCTFAGVIWTPPK